MLISSLYQSGTSHLLIPHSEHFNAPDFCVTWWMYLLTDSTGQWRTVLHKGNADHERTPTFFLEPQTRGLEFFVSTSETENHLSLYDNIQVTAGARDATSFSNRASPRNESQYGCKRRCP